MKGQEVWGGGDPARRGQCTCILAADADADGAARPFSRTRERTREDVAGFRTPCGTELTAGP